MQWWGWIVVGTLLFCAELFAIDAQFYLIFLGAGALTVGVVSMAGLGLPPWGEWLLFATLSIACMVAFRRRLYDKIRGGPVHVSDAVIGEKLRLREELPPGGTCRAEYRGSTWTVLNVGPDPIRAGASATIEAMDGLTLRVRLTSD
jgi:membrane protein implicated in regulation of membrane protease activity